MKIKATFIPLLGAWVWAHGMVAVASQAVACPSHVPASARCYAADTPAGAHVMAILPASWQASSGVAVMHAHGGPGLGKASIKRVEEDAARWAIMPSSGYAWAGTSYRRGGYGVAVAAEDMKDLQQWFVAQFGQPRRMVLHGQSYGGGVASVAAERYGSQPEGKSGRPVFDAVLLTSSVLGGGVDAYTMRLDLRAVYQFYCRNHPLPSEPQYPLWQGLPADSTLDRAELERRVHDCTGNNKPAAERTPAQAQRLAAILAAVPVTDKSLIGHLTWGTFLFRDVTQKRLGNRNPFDNSRTHYQGLDATSEAVLNQGVLRYTADPQAVGQLLADSRPTGRTTLPTLTIRGIHDPTAFVELAQSYQQIREAAGTAAHLMQVYTGERGHSYLSDPEYRAVMAALLDWVDKGEQPTPQSVAERCAAEAGKPPVAKGSNTGCHIELAYQPAALETRVPGPRP
ncbi:MAG: hypothetical protein RSD57_15735 [Comamonas sp.]